MMKTSIATLGTIIVFSLVLFASYSCHEKSGERYYKAQADCVAHSGTWIGSDGYGGTCVIK